MVYGVPLSSITDMEEARRKYIEDLKNYTLPNGQNAGEYMLSKK